MITEEKKNKVGRPTKYKQEYCDVAIELMSEGASLIEVAAAVGASSYQTLYDWMKANPDFLEAIKKGELLSQSWWERKGREGVEANQFNSTLWFMNMKNRFHKGDHAWRDKREHELTGKNGGDIKTDNTHKVVFVRPGEVEEGE